MDKPAQPSNPGYFLENEFTEKKPNIFFVKLQSGWRAFQYYARQVWPYIYRLINFLTYETIKTIKGIAKIALQQVGMFKD